MTDEKKPPEGGNLRATGIETAGKPISCVKDTTTDIASQYIPAFSNLSPAFPLTENPSCYVVALAWLDAGCELVPLQPNTKHLVTGFGPYCQHIFDYQGAWDWFSKRRCNLGVVTGAGLCVLDIDEPSALERLLKRCPELRGTWTVKTKRGVHLYLQGGPADLRSFKFDGVEVKAGGAVVTSWPSRVGDFVYRPLKVTCPILGVPPTLLSLSEEKQVITLPQGKVLSPQDGDLVARIKSAWPLEELCQAAGIALSHSTTHDGRWLVGKCPAHDDQHASFWIDTQRGLFGCHACQDAFHGDVIDLYGYVHHIKLQDAIRQMARRLHD